MAFNNSGWFDGRRLEILVTMAEFNIFNFLSFFGNSDKRAEPRCRKARAGSASEAEGTRFGRALLAQAVACQRRVAQKPDCRRTKPGFPKFDFKSACVCDVGTQNDLVKTGNALIERKICLTPEGSSSQLWLGSIPPYP
jgi:hypothetical protein